MFYLLMSIYKLEYIVVKYAVWKWRVSARLIHIWKLRLTSGRKTEMTQTSSTCLNFSSHPVAGWLGHVLIAVAEFQEGAGSLVQTFFRSLYHICLLAQRKSHGPPKWRELCLTPTNVMETE